MKMHKSITLDRVIELVEQDDCMGICLACGEDAYGVEPDAWKYPCESCQKDEVYGADEILMMMA